MSIVISRLLLIVALSFGSVVSFSGCQSSAQSGQTDHHDHHDEHDEHDDDHDHKNDDQHGEHEHEHGDDHEHGHSHHHQPTHKPADYPAAVSRLEELHASMRADDVDTHDAVDAIEEMFDIARWLPELAADSDLTETPWNRVHACSFELQAEYDKLLSVEADQQVAAYKSGIVKLESALKQLRKVAAHFSG